MSDNNHGQPTPPKSAGAWVIYSRDGEMRYLLTDPSPVEACRRYENVWAAVAQALRDNDRLDRELNAARDEAQVWRKLAEERAERLGRVELELDKYRAEVERNHDIET